MIYDNPIGMLLAAGTETMKDTLKNTGADEKKEGDKKEERCIVRELRTNV